MMMDYPNYNPGMPMGQGYGVDNQLPQPIMAPQQGSFPSLYGTANQQQGFTSPAGLRPTYKRGGLAKLFKKALPYIGIAVGTALGGPAGAVAGGALGGAAAGDKNRSGFFKGKVGKNAIHGGLKGAAIAGGMHLAGMGGQGGVLSNLFSGFGGGQDSQGGQDGMGGQRGGGLSNLFGGNGGDLLNKGLLATALIGAFKRKVRPSSPIQMPYAPDISQWGTQDMPRPYSDGGRYYQGDAGGQDDNINARVSPGEYVIDADAVSAFGDGNNAAGAKNIKMAIKNLRVHKRSVGPNSIPPKAKSLASYMSVRQKRRAA